MSEYHPWIILTYNAPLIHSFTIQDHNYGQPPPPTPPQSPPPTLDAIPVLPLATIYENANPSFTPPEDNAEAQNNEGDTRCIW